MYPAQVIGLGTPIIVRHGDLYAVIVRVARFDAAGPGEADIASAFLIWSMRRSVRSSGRLYA